LRNSTSLLWKLILRRPVADYQDQYFTDDEQSRSCCKRKIPNPKHYLA